MPIQQRSQLKGFGQSTNEKYIVEDINSLNVNKQDALKGNGYLIVTANGTDIENAETLQAAYITAQSMSPSATNRITIIATPGYYNFQSTAFTLDTEYIDLVSLDGNRSVIFNSSDNLGTISITANDVFVKGIDVQTKAFKIATNLNLLKVENCKGGHSSFTISGGIVSGTFTDCTGGSDSFNGNTISGTFNNCVSGSNSFGYTYSAPRECSGKFTNCTATSGFSACYQDFGGGGAASGTFNNCITTSTGFGFGQFGGVASGTFNNCIAGGGFGVNGSLTGKLYYCRLTSGTFRTVSGSGKTRYCLDSTDTPNNQG